MEKKCANCSNMDICRVYCDLADIAEGLNFFMRMNDLNQNRFTVMVDTMAHDCINFEKYQE